MAELANQVDTPPGVKPGGVLHSSVPSSQLGVHQQKARREAGLFLFSRKLSELRKPGMT
jgi:hypothetical protein